MNDFFNLIGDFFQNRPLTNEEQFLLGVLAILLLMLGVIIGWIVQGMTTRRYKKELLLLRKDRDEYEARYRATESKQKALAKELEAVSREKVAALDEVQTLRAELASRSDELTGVRQQNERLSVTNQSYESTIETLNDQVIGLKTQNEQLLERTNALENSQIDSPANAVPNQPGYGEQGQFTNPGRDQTNDNLNAYIATAEARFALLEERLRALAAENADLRTIPPPAPVPAPPTGPYVGHQPIINQDLPTTFVAGEPLVIRADTTEPGARTGHQGATEVIVQTTPSIQVPPMGNTGSAPVVDDLTLIDKIGPFLQRKLNEVDVYRYDQIAAWTEADIATYTELIGYIPGIIERDDWVGQARGLAMSEAAQRRQADPAPTPEGGNEGQAASTEPDNLRVVEGIGPKIEALLKEAGVMTLSQLADTPAEDLRRILDEAGPRFRSHDPKSWPVQAGLAADGKMEQLRAWQQELKGGR